MRDMAGDAMRFDRVEFDLQHDHAIHLLRSENAPLVVSFLYLLYKREPRTAIPYTECVERLDGLLDEINASHPDRFPRPAQAYIKDWLGDQHPVLRRYVRSGSDDALVELTAETERVIGWVEDLHRREFIGTESRFLQIFQLLEDIVFKSGEDIEARLAHLERQKEAIQREIDTLRATGELAQYSGTQIKERFHEAGDVARRLLRDFSAVEDEFRAIARSVREEQLKADVRKGSLVGFVLDADAALKETDQGRSFYAFWDFLMSPTMQDRLEELLEQVYALPQTADITRANPTLRRLAQHLLDAGEKIVLSNHRLAEHLRRFLDERNLAESRRARELIAEIKRDMIRLSETPPADDAFLTLEGAPDVDLVMERRLWEPSETPDFAGQVLQPGAADLSSAAVERLYDHFHVDEETLRWRIDQLLERRSQITLAELARFYPIEQGLAEVIHYVVIAARDERHVVNDALREEVVIGAPAGAGERGEGRAAPATALIPQVIFRRGHDAF